MKTNIIVRLHNILPTLSGVIMTISVVLFANEVTAAVTAPPPAPVSAPPPNQVPAPAPPPAQVSHPAPAPAAPPPNQVPAPAQPKVSAPTPAPVSAPPPNQVPAPPPPPQNILQVDTNTNSVVVQPVVPQSLLVQPPTQLFPWGSSNALTQFAVTNTQDVVVGVYQGNVSGGVAGYWGYSYSSITSITSAFQQSLVFAANLAMTNPAINKNAPIFVAGYADNEYYPPTLGCLTFAVSQNPSPSFNLIHSNGAWILPDLSGITMPLAQQLVFYVPGLEWGRIEVYSNVNMMTPFLVVDSRNSSSSSATNGVDIPDQAITIATPYLASGNAGPYRLKVSMLTANGFKISDGNGMQIAETPIAPAITIANGMANITVTGGDPGRVFFIQQSSNLLTWTSACGPYTVGTNGWSVNLHQTMSKNSFYRTVTTNAVPQ